MFKKETKERKIKEMKEEENALFDCDKEEEIIEMKEEIPVDSEDEKYDMKIENNVDGNQ